MGKIGKNLENLLRKTAILLRKTAITILSIPLVVLPYGCEPEEPEPPVNKSIEQSVNLNNDVEINYSATLSNVDKAQLNVKKEGVSISTEQINDVSSTGVDYQKTYTYSANPNITKGNYEFVLTSDNLEKKNSFSIPNYKPTGNFTNLSLDINLDENSEINVTLPNTPDKIFDKNPEDNPVSYVNAKSLDGKTSLTLNGNNLNIKSLSNTGHYELELEFGSVVGGLEKSVLQGNITGDNRIKIDPFTYIYNPNAVINTLTNKTDIDNLIQSKLDGDWVYTIPESDKPPWGCGHYAMEELIQSNDFPEKIYIDFPDFTDGDLLYNGNTSRDLNEIYKNHGTLSGKGSLELPMGIMVLKDTSHYGGDFGHSMNWVASGTNLMEFSSINPIESQRRWGNVQPGEWVFFPKDCDVVFLEYWYVQKQDNKDYIKPIILAKFRLEDGVATLIWDNKDPRYNIRKER